MEGIFYHYLADLARRKSFSETRRYMKALIKIEGTKSQKVCICLLYCQPFMYIHVVCDCLGCAVLLCLVCLFV